MGKDIEFTRSFAGSRIIRRGDIWRNVSIEEATQWIAAGHAKPVEHASVNPQVETASLIHAGAGWYILPNGERIRGKEAAEAAMEQPNG
jgi:hypothetical protein